MGVRVKWETVEARFIEVSVGRPGADAPRHVFRFGEDIEFRAVAELRVSVPSCWIALVLLDHRGSRVSLGVHEFQRGWEPGTHEIRLCLRQPNLRHGEYVVSLELLPQFDYDWQGAVRLPYLCHWDRCVHFKIDEDYHGSIELGLICVQMDVTEQLLMSTASETRAAEPVVAAEPRGAGN
jgi:hypothetical protein